MPVNNPRHSRFFWRSSAMFGILDFERQFKEVNAAWETTLGLSTGQLLAKHFFDFIHSDDLPETQYYFDQLDDGISSLSFSARFRHYSGAYRNVLWEINGAASADYAYYLVGMDITKREQPMVADEMVHVLQEGVVLQYANGTIGACNPSAQRILGLSVEQMMGWTLIDPDWQLIREDGSPFPTEAHPAICTLRTGQSYADVVMGIVKSDESVIWIRVHSYPLWRDDVTTPYAVVISFSDITLYKETAVLSLKSSAQQQGQVVPDNNYDLWDWDLTTNELHFSPRWEKMLGFEAHELLPHLDSWYKRIHPSDYNQVKADIQNHLKGYTKVCENTHRLQHKDGSYRLILSRAVMIPDSNGQPHRMVGTHVDITEHQSIEDEVNEIENKYRQVMEIESDAICLVNAETLDIIDVNKAATLMYGYSRSQLLKLQQTALSAQPDKTVKLIKKGIKSISTQYHKKPDGTVFPVEVITTPFLFKGKQVLMVAVRDISERQNIEAALWENESKYRQLFEATSNPTVVFDANTQQIFDVNQAAVDLYGYGKNEWSQMKTEDVSAEPMKRGGFGNSRRVIPLRWHKKKDGTIFPVEISTGNTYLFQGRSLVCATLRDMTERKAHEEALRQERDFVKSLIEASPAFFVAINPDGKTRMMNKAMLQATTYSFEEIVNADFLAFFVPQQEHPLVSTEFENLIKSMRPSLMECHIKSKSGQSLLVEWHSRAVVKADGALDYFFGVGIDMTERKKREGHLRLFKSIIESSDEAIAVRNTEKQLVYINPAYERLFGHNFKEIKQLSLKEHYSPHSLKIFLEEVKSALRSGNSWDGELDVYHKDGSVFPIWQRVDAVRDAKGNVLFSFGLMHDISERQRMWETLRKQWQEYQTIFNTLPAMIWYRDKDNRLLRSNQLAEKTFKNRENEVEEYTDCKEVIQLGRPRTGVVRSVKLRSGSLHKQYSNKKQDSGSPPPQGDGEIRLLQFDKIPYRDAIGNLTGVIVFAIDITKHRQPYEESIPEPIPEPPKLPAFREDKPLLVSVLEAARLGVCLTDDRGRFLTVNQAYADLYGYRPEELVGQPFTMVLAPNLHDNAVREYYSLLMTHEAPKFFKRRGEQHRNGQFFDVQILAGSIVLEDKRRMLVSVVSKLIDKG